MLSARREMRSTGFDPLDEALNGGFAPEELVVVAGRPGVGKSIAVVQWARHLAMAGRKVTLACYEHSEIILMTQLLLLELGYAVDDPMKSSTARRLVDKLIHGRRTWLDTVSSEPLLDEAAQRLREYSANLVLLDSGGRSGGFDTLADAARTTEILIVDHLGKIGEEGTERAAVRCKELAIAHGLTVIATAAVNHSGIDARRVRTGHVEGSAGVAHEADIEIILNDKITIVSKNHTAYDPVRAETFKGQVVFSIEKNRRGIGDVDLEFTRDFAHRRFKPSGSFVTERLVDNVLTVE
ncbi:MAG: hypothetical protein HKN94_13465 [Acidimicrobiales bacterium]|nr:hypothetical protein [Acidimicrobiales bacterium]